jgi:glutamate 5-kinase
VKEILIAKFGTKCVVNGESIAQDRVNRHAKRFAGLLSDYRLGIVSSGSVGAGSRKISSHRPDLVGKLDKRTLAAIGSSSAFHTWRRAFGRLEFEGMPIVAAELKATHDNMDHPDERRSLAEVFLNCVNYGIVPVFNINDPLDRYKDELGGIEEGRDNDHAAEHLARIVGANTLLLLTAKVGGVLVDGKVQPKISISDMSGLEAHLTGTDEDGTGSMASKIQAGINAMHGGVENVYIGSSSADPRLILAGQQGTQLVA